MPQRDLQIQYNPDENPVSFFVLTEVNPQIHGLYKGLK